MTKKKKAIIAIFSIALITILCFTTTSVKANYGDCINEITRDSNGGLSGWMLSHKINNEGLNYYVGSRDRNTKNALNRNNDESRTNVNREQTMNETFNYDDIGISGMSTGNDEWIWAEDGNGNVTCMTKLVPVNQANQVAHIAGTQCDIRDESGNRISDFTHFVNGANYTIVGDAFQATLNGQQVNMYNVQVSKSSLENLGTSYNNRSYVQPATDPDDMTTVSVFDSCIVRQEATEAALTPEEQEELDKIKDNTLSCGGGFGTLDAACGSNTDPNNACGTTESSYFCDGSYETGYKFGAILTDAQMLYVQELKEQEFSCSADCGTAQCGISLQGKVDITIHKPEGPKKNIVTVQMDDGTNLTGFRTGTYFNDYFIQYKRQEPEVSAGYISCGGSGVISCNRPAILTETYDCRPVIVCGGGEDDPEECEDKEEGTAISNPSYVRENCYKEVVGREECTPQSAVAKCEEELGLLGTKVTMEGDIKYEDTKDIEDNTISGSEEIDSALIEQMSSGNSEFKYYPRMGAKLDKKTAKVTYELDLSEDYGNDLYLGYAHSHFIPLKWPTGTLSIIASLDVHVDFNVTGLNDLDFTIDSECPVETIRLYNPDKPIIGPVRPDDPNNGDFEFIYRPIELTAPFPNRDPGYNWYEAAQTMSTRLKNTYSNEPVFSIHLDNALIREIREYNNQQDSDIGAGYLNYSIGPNGDDEFLNLIKTNYSGYIIKNNTTTGFKLGCGPKNSDEVGCQ